MSSKVLCKLRRVTRRATSFWRAGFCGPPLSAEYGSEVVIVDATLGTTTLLSDRTRLISRPTEERFDTEGTESARARRNGDGRIIHGSVVRRRGGEWAGDFPGEEAGRWRRACRRTEDFRGG